jgi:hypothetical protein
LRSKWSKFAEDASLPNAWGDFCRKLINPLFILIDLFKMSHASTFVSCSEIFSYTGWSRYNLPEEIQ